MWEDPRSTNEVEEGEASQTPAPLLVVDLQLCMPCVAARRGSAPGNNWVCWAQAGPGWCCSTLCWLP